ncbi:MAG TPA: sigma-54 dependent transcriptional regulator [Vicinamibacterales bacterium]|jgi:DNA-binding NtrC family response regulator
MSQRALPCILVVEDDLDLRQTIVASLEANGFAAAQASDAADAIAQLRSSAYDGIVVDLRLPDADGTTVLDEALDRYPQIRAVVMTGFGGIAEAVTAVKRGGVDFLIKPFQLSQLARVLQAGLEQQRLREENAQLKAQLKGKFRFENIIGRHSTMQALLTTLELVSPMQSTVLIHGETGTGKELIARTIHHNSPRASERFVPFNAAALPETLAEAELFGHMSGAATGGMASRAGRFELAHRGTLFIDEVESMSLPLQAKVLRALQEREIERVGESRPMRLDIRVIAATNMDLRKMVKDGSFREDLFYRLNVIPVTLPALRQRREDIPLLAQHFVRKSCHDNSVALKTLSQDAMQVLMAYDWPGNIRQFENAIEHAVAMSAARTEIGPEALPEDVRERAASMLVPTVAIPDEGLNFTSLVSQLERELILRCLEKTGGNKRQAARLLNLSRTTFIDKLHRLNLERGAA